MNVERFFHIRPAGSHKGGATVRVTGDTGNIGTVNLQVAFCSKKDPFCRSIGRDVATKAAMQVVPLRYLPARLVQVRDKVERMSKNIVMTDDFSFACRYFLPKE